MNEIFPCDPSPDENMSLEGAINFLQKFGPKEGRFIASYPHSWCEEFKESICKQEGSSSERQKQKLLTMLDRTRKYLVPLQAKYNKSKPWVKNAINIAKKEAQILVSDNGCNERFITYEEATYGDLLDLEQNVSRELRSNPNYWDCVWPLFAFSTEVYIADSYLLSRTTKSDDKYHYWEKKYPRELDLVAELVDKAWRLGRTERIIILLTERRTDAKDSQKVRESTLKDLEAINNEYQDSISLEARFISPSEHDRWIFSSKGAIQLGSGFSFVPHSFAKNTISWFGEQMAGELFRDFKLY